MKLAQLLKDGFSSKNFGNCDLDETTSIIRDQFRKFVEDDVARHVRVARLEGVARGGVDALDEHDDLELGPAGR